MLVTRLKLYLVGALLLLGGAWALLQAGIRIGEEQYRAEQAETNQQTAMDILEAINNGTLDSSDDAAVLAELCRLAGLAADDERCSVRRDD